MESNRVDLVQYTVWNITHMLSINSQTAGFVFNEYNDYVSYWVIHLSRIKF